MQTYHEPQWSLNKLVSPNSVGAPITMGNYYCSSRAFAQGTFGKVSAGWSKIGSVVAIKQFKKPTKSDVSDHQSIMRHIGRHDNILQLLDCVSHFDTNVPDAFCVYAPLAMASLTEVIIAYEPDFDAKVTILMDCLSGLSYLHDQKNIMHRDINPNNIAIVSFDNPKGVIIDLDSATMDQTSTDHGKGTIMYLAPEIIELKKWNGQEQQPSPYGKEVDLWALGLSMFACYFGQPFSWAQLLPRDKTLKISMVTEKLHIEFHERIDRRAEELNSAEIANYLLWIIEMTEYDPSDRISASELLKHVRVFAKHRGKGSIALRSGLKRRREEQETQAAAR